MIRSSSWFCQKQKPNATTSTAAADDQPRAQLVEVVDEAQPILVADRTERSRHESREPTTAPSRARALKAAASGVDDD